MRLDKLLANYGIGTRKEVKSLIRKGFVKVNGMIIKKDDFKVDHEIDEIVFELNSITFSFNNVLVFLFRFSHSKHCTFPGKSIYQL